MCEGIARCGRVSWFVNPILGAVVGVGLSSRWSSRLHRWRANCKVVVALLTFSVRCMGYGPGRYLCA